MWHLPHASLVRGGTIRRPPRAGLVVGPIVRRFEGRQCLVELVRRVRPVVPVLRKTLKNKLLEFGRHVSDVMGRGADSSLICFKRTSIADSASNRVLPVKSQ